MNTKNESRGYVIAIGGAENRSRNSTILNKFVALCGGKQARIGIIPTASELKNTGNRYKEVFEKLGASNAHVLNIEYPRDCERTDYLSLLDEVDGVFMTGGDQSRLAKAIGDSKFADKLKAQNHRGMHIAGTSAGAAYISQFMIAKGKSGITPQTNMVKMSQGLGLSDTLIIDQHFRQRHRIGRLVTALTTQEQALGVGIDEDTAIFIAGNDEFEVAGSGWVTVIDPTNMKFAALSTSRKREHLRVTGLNVHMLGHGDRYCVKNRVPLI